MLERFRVYGYGGEVLAVRARSARAAARFVDFAVMLVKDARGAPVTPDLWAA